MSFDRNAPFPARLVDKRLLTTPGSARPTLHVALSIAVPGEGAGFPYEPGDVVGVLVHNEPQLVSRVLARLAFSGDEQVTVQGVAMPIARALGAATPARWRPTSSARSPRSSTRTEATARSTSRGCATSSASAATSIDLIQSASVGR